MRRRSREQRDKVCGHAVTLVDLERYVCRALLVLVLLFLQLQWRPKVSPKVSLPFGPRRRFAPWAAEAAAASDVKNSAVELK